jgi:hypothetical protein
MERRNCGPNLDYAVNAMWILKVQGILDSRGLKLTDYTLCFEFGAFFMLIGLLFLWA